MNLLHDGRIHKNNGCPHSADKERHLIILLLGVIKIVLIFQQANGSLREVEWGVGGGQAMASRRRDLQAFTNEDVKMSKHNGNISKGMGL